ncbi:MAG: hypothetical protein KBA31_03305 [Alphaproteobacteria bacterium]|nr:hypothetical protein [Alphaproteobacteria bacterium]
MAKPASWLRRGAGFFSAAVSLGGESTKIEWVHDSDFRFFPVIADETFGYVLNPIDLAVNKIAAAADRQVARDLVDLLTIHRHIIPLGAGARGHAFRDTAPRRVDRGHGFFRAGGRDAS